MRIPRIYTDQVLQEGEVITLEEQASQHLSRVLRLNEGHPIELFNGQGGSFQAHITTLQKKQVQVRCLDFQADNSHSRLKLHLLIALSKGDKMELIIQKATELGVDTISPIITSNSDVKINTERQAKKLRQWQHVAISACEQSGRNRLPSINPINTFSDSLKTLDQGQILMFHPRAGSTLSNLFGQQSTLPNTLYCCFGSEGGFTEQEVVAAEAVGGLNITLDGHVLRAETAPIAVCGAIKALAGEW
ncbi:MAG: 16S rRNA (uracil(1498)-N(3))-methyltransferase [Pseudomonadales bacterium]|nr:16S rRNA (uracil(1498)-N(3))-methyltransferase [Pseudomonadales bacterium]